MPEIVKIEHADGRTVEPPKPIPWYPNELAWDMTTPKNIVRKFAPFSAFQKFLVSETSIGNISRQEVVSMIPPLVMDLRPGMTVLDMCASPGSKATQLLEMLPAIIAALLLALAFEKRSTSGSSVGANVRDAACFGIWALARRYTTAELLAVPTGETTSSSSSSSAPPSILQRLATELTVTASLDPAGNIRRGASAGLQELIGRHPDTVDKGIWLVLTVDYHAVALRARALHEGALKAAKLSPVYGRALLRGLLDWRG
ncbi:hypothetical protein BN1708_016911, partial [Verticillium longisporum]